MARPLSRDKVMTRTNLMPDKNAMEKAQRKAAKNGLEVLSVEYI